MSQSLYPDPPTDPEAAEASRPKGGPGIANDRYPRDLDDLARAAGAAGSRTARPRPPMGEQPCRNAIATTRTAISGVPAEKEALKARGQPEITINKIADKVER